MRLPEWLWRRRWEKVADRPHPMSILLSFVTPVIALLAFVLTARSYLISFEALQTSKQAVDISHQGLQLAQRAYVVIRNGTFTYKEGMRLLNPPAKGWDNDVYFVNWSFDIVNSGNTPAELVGLMLTPSMPKGWSYRSDDNFSSWNNFGYVGPRDSVKWSSPIHINVPPAYMRGHFRPRIREDVAGLPWPGDFEVRWKLTYRDVFKEIHVVEWCWADAAKSPYPALCAADYEMRVSK